MPWGNKFPDLKNDPSYLEGRLSNAETSLAQITQQKDHIFIDLVAEKSADNTGVQDVSSIINANADTTNLLLIEGNYLISNTVNLKNNIRIKGKGIDKTVIKSNVGANKNPITNFDHTNGNTNIVIEDLTLDCTNDTNTSTLTAIGLYNSSNVIFKNVKVINSQREGFAFTGCKNVVVDDCIADGNKWGFAVLNNGATQSDTVTFLNCKAYNSLLDGFNTYDGNNIKFSMCHAEHNGIGNVTVNPLQYACGFYIQGTNTKNILVMNCSTKNNTGAGIELDNSFQVVVNGFYSTGDFLGSKIIGGGSRQFNTIKGMTVYNSTTTGTGGIYLANTKANTIENITVIDDRATKQYDYGVTCDWQSGSDENIITNINVNGYKSNAVNSFGLNNIYGVIVANGVISNQIPFITTATRPIAPYNRRMLLFDTTLNNIIVNDGTNWRDANGVIAGNKGLNKAVSVSATSLAVSFTTAEPDANYLVSVSPAWNTTYWITNKATSGFTINFGTAPASASTLDWSIKR